MKMKSNMYVVYLVFYVSVKRKDRAVTVILDVDDKANCSKDEAIVEKLHLSSGVKLLANEEFNKEWEGYETESEDNVPDQPEEAAEVETASAGNAGSKKRKASRKLKSPKYLFNPISKQWFSCDLYCFSVDTSYPRDLKVPLKFDFIYFTLNNSVLF